MFDCMNARSNQFHYYYFMNEIENVPELIPSAPHHRCWLCFSLNNTAKCPDPNRWIWNENWCQTHMHCKKQTCRTAQIPTWWTWCAANVRRCVNNFNLFPCTLCPISTMLLQCIESMATTSQTKAIQIVQTNATGKQCRRQPTTPMTSASIFSMVFNSMFDSIVIRWRCAWNEINERMVCVRHSFKEIIFFIHTKCNWLI